VSLDSGSVVVPKLGWMSGALSSVVWFLGLVSIQKNWAGTCLFFFFLRLIEIAAKLLPSFLKKTTTYPTC
jgi:hypothetical protein